MRFNTLSEIKRSLKQLRLKKGSSCLLHSSINGIGPIKGINIKKIPEVIVDLIFKEIGDNGTLSVMTPYYDYGLKNKKFDIKNSPSARELGAISSYIYNKKNSFRSLNPLFAISSIGKKAKHITSGKTPTAFGFDSAWDKLFKLNSKILFLGCDMSVCTFVRYIEFRFGVPYLYNKHFNNKIVFNKKILSNYSTSTLRYSYLYLNYDVLKFQKILIRKKLLKIISNKKFKAMSIDMKPCFDSGIENLKKNLFFFLKNSPKYKRKLTPIA